MTSIWLDRPLPFHSDEFHARSTHDTVVVGAGLTGLVTAVLLARGGKNVLVLEARHPAAVTTGNTTAKLTVLQGTTLSALRGQYSQKMVDSYVEGNREGQAWLLRYLESGNVPFQRRDAYTYATTPGGVTKVREEISVGRAAGLEMEFTRDTGLPFAVEGAVRLAEQAQFNPLDVVDALTADLRDRGGRIVHGVRVTNVTGTRAATVETDHGPVRAQEVILATGIPILDRGLYFAKVKPMRSYAAALQLPAGSTPPQGMYLSVESPVRSVRSYPVNGKELLLVGGSGHQVARTESERAHLDDLLSWASAHFPGAEPTHTWSAQDYHPVNLMPFFGRLPRGRGRIYLATGYNKWGMTNAVAAALAITGDILGGHVTWAKTIHHRVTSPKGIAEGISLNADVAAKLASDRAELRHKKQDTDPAALPVEGAGKVLRSSSNNKPVAVSTTNGKTCKVSAVCTHLGGILHWNDSEKSWDCPLHGSRFTNEGKLLEGPATRDLQVMD
jgi:glycine/D-amino acid oxidase-like deaminating enzyme/nitrite reductase/ring-hydroxylating ferredoxin subunit